MRYPDGGGLCARGRAQREAVRLRAAVWFAEGVSVAEAARWLRVSQTAVYGWDTGGVAAVSGLWHPGALVVCGAGWTLAG